MRLAKAIGLVAILALVLAASLTLGGGDTDNVSPAPTGVSTAPESTRSASPAPLATAEPVDRAPATPPPSRAASPPARITVGAVDIDASVVPVGVADDRQMELPPDPNVLGWYRYGPTVGDATGSVMLAGHVDSRRFGIGQLARLEQAEPGDAVVVETADGASKRYIVEQVESISKPSVPLTDLFRRDGDAQLVLVTCGGEFDPDGGGYSDNVVVKAVPG